ncbi:DUF4259 domain-containing protein [Niastella sp. OAS944]|uniref:DUF4259 domain-containing protein n=1 Tax=Niastella sp. OAS944 TaxID=2664089 RepID=UPI0034708906|nr:hypothetical protein [Chitinophagaceae bacterium OAS944]
MGAWGPLNFENDTALDLVYEIEEEGANRIKIAIEAVNSREEDSFLDSDLCSEALAAIEYIAAAKDKVSEDFPEDAEEWLTPANKETLLAIRNLIANSKQAIDRIKHNSELKDLWEETEEFEEWNKVLDGLVTRIS